MAIGDAPLPAFLTGILKMACGLPGMRRPGRLVLYLCLLWLVRTSPARAEDDQVDYRHEYYQEDDSRMRINTDSVFANADINQHFGLTGTYVEDAISGATPTGAPPFSQWLYPTYASYYNQSYSQLYQAAVNNNLYLYQAGYFSTYQAFTNYVAANNPQLGAQATNSANSSYNSLTNNPNFRRNTVETIHLHDHRRAFSIGTPITFGINQFTPEVSVSKESDYHSYGASFNDSVLLNQKNTTLTGGWSFDNDRVRDDSYVNWQGKISNDFFLGVNQLLTPKSYMTFDLTYGTEHGYLSDPYRGVMLADVMQSPEAAALSPENRPGHRDKVTFYTGYTQFVTPLNGSMEASYRFFHDTSEIFAQTVELSWHQKIGRHLVLSPLFRYYYQTAANYYYVVVPDIYDAAQGKYVPAPQFYSSDYRLSEMETFTWGLSLTYRIQKHVSVDLSYTRYVMQGMDGLTSQSAYPSANIASVGFRLWF